MGLLLDTPAVIWWWLDAPLLGARARRALTADEQPTFVSAVSALEIGIKFRIGKLPEFGDPALLYPRLMARDGFTALPVTESHALAAGLLPGEHRDPFDRIVAAQALAEGLTVLTIDPAFAAFGCRVLW